jgi:hypothetical protein
MPCSRLHRWTHRIAGSCVALVGVLTTFQGINLTPYLGADGAAKVLLGSGLFIVALEFLPILDGWLTEDVDADRPDVAH